MQQYTKEFLVSRVHIPNLTRINYKQDIIYYYSRYAYKTVYIFPYTVFIEMLE
ncbi:hypothetical protein M6KS0526p2_2725 [Staphylococcus aureus]|nr:hypothetical protein M6KS0526p2_2725 [Staphylococcus aureus]